MKAMTINPWSRLGLAAKVLLVFLTLSILSLVVVGSIALVNTRSMADFSLESSTSLANRAVADSSGALEAQAKESLLRLARDQAAISNAVFEKAEAGVSSVARLATILSENPTTVGYRRSYSQDERPENEETTSAYLLAPGVAVDAVREELAWSSNLDLAFTSLHSSDANLTWIFVGTESGVMRIFPWTLGIDPSFDPRARPWYSRAKRSGVAGWSELYVDAAGRGLMMTYSTPVYDSKKWLVGVVGADVTVETINQRIINTQVGQRGYAFLIDNEGEVIARPGLAARSGTWDRSVEGENLLRTENPELSEIARDMIAGKSAIAVAKMEGGESYIAFAPLPSTQWSLGLVVPVEEVIAPALAAQAQITSASRDTSEGIDRKLADLRNAFIGIFAVMLLVVSGLAFLLSRTITRPIAVVTNLARAMERGDVLEEQIATLRQTEGQDEVSTLSRVFAGMAAEVKAREARLKRQVEELRIEIDHTKKAKQVAEITETDYFQSLRQKARQLRTNEPTATEGSR